MSRGEKMEKYNLIANDVRKKILEGVYQPNEQLPFEKRPLSSLQC